MKLPKQSLRILFVSPYYPPEMGAPQARISDLAVRLVRRGHNVTVLTGFPNYPTGIIPPEYRGKWFLREESKGVKIIRTWIYPTSNTRLYWRLINYLSYVVSSIISSFRCGRADVLYVESPPLFDGIAGYIISRMKQAPYLFNVADLWPDFAVELGLVRKSVFLKIAYWMEAFFYRKAGCVATVTKGLIDRLHNEKKIPADKLMLLMNGADLKTFHPDISGSEIRKKFNIQEKFTAGYIGNIGHWQGLETIIDAAAILADDPKYHFLLIGDGARKEAIEKHIADRKLNNVTLLPVQPREDIPAYWAAVDCALVPLRKVVCAEQALPVKIFEAMAMAKPVILGIGGEARSLVNDAKAGVAVEPENSESYAEAIKHLAEDKSARENMGFNGRKYVEKHFDRDKLAEIVEKVFLKMVQV